MTGDLTFSINGERHTAHTPARFSLADVLRDSARLTGTNMGCREGWCGACTVLVDGRSARSCITLAVAVDGAAVTTVEGLAAADGTLTALQDAFVERGAMECGFCTPGFLMVGTELVEQVRAGGPVPSRAELVDVLSGNLCRCTGYDPIIDAVASVLEAAAHE